MTSPTAETKTSGLKEIARDSMDHALYVEENGVGGNRYWSDEIGGGVVVWDTSLVSEEMLRLALRAESARSVLAQQEQE